jgi:hypothetical protein
MMLYYDDELELEMADTVYLVQVHATAAYTYTAGRMYMDNGDPGYPPEDDFEITDIDAVWLDENDKEIQPTEEMRTALEKYLNEMDFSRWNELEPEDY